VLARVDLTARTEVADAYNTEHLEALRDAARADASFAKRLKSAKLVRVWSSVLESTTCEECAEHDGDETDLDDDFDGDEPGEMHPGCLCTAFIATESGDEDED
jgi:hypothetical protein